MNFLSWLPKTFCTNKLNKAKSAKLNILNILNIHVQSYQGINEDDILYKYFYSLTRQIEMDWNSQGCCLMGAYMRFYHWATKILNEELEWASKTYHSQRLTSTEQTTNPGHSALLKRKRKTFSCQQ